jgi:signal transduction histidine kinase
MTFAAFKNAIARAVENRKALGERLAHLKPIRDAIIQRILVFSWIALVAANVLLALAGVGRSVFLFGTAVWPAICLLVATFVFRSGSKRNTEVCAAFLFQAIGFAATWAQAALIKSYGHGYPQYEGILILTILLSGLLVGEFFVGAWTFICCASFQFAIMVSSDWKTNAGWSAVYVAAAWLVIQFSRQLERYFEANRLAEEQQRNAIVAERTRFARDIHDTLAQGFTGIMMQLNAAEQRVDADGAGARFHIEKARQLATESLEEARRSVSALRIGAHAEGTLLEAMEQIGRRLSADSGVQLETKLEGQPYALPELCETNLLRIAQEAMTNAVRHSRSKQIGLRLRYQTGSVVLEIDDSGIGMTGQEPSGFGVDNMRERTRQMGGQIQILSDPGRGTRIVVTIPNA